MTPLFPTQRAAEELDSVLDGTASRAVADRHADLVAIVELLQDRPEVQPRVEFVDSLRARLMTAAETELAAAAPVARTATVTPLRRRNRRLGTVAASLVIVGGSAGMAAAASGALPGEALYPIKRGGEQVTTAVRIGEVSKGKALLGQAENRLEEIEAMVASGSPEPNLVAGAVESFRSSADAGSEKLFLAYQSSGDPADITTVRTFAAEQMASVAQLAGSSDAGTATLLVDAADTLADIDQQARVLCGGCGPVGAVEPPQALSDGAAAASVANLIARPAAQAKADVAAAAEAARQQREAEAGPGGQLDTKGLADLQAAAERSAGEIPRGGAEGLASADGRTAATRSPVRSTITKAGELVPVVTGSTAVSGLLTGVTGTLDSVTGGLPGLDDAVDETTDELTGTLGLDP